MTEEYKINEIYEQFQKNVLDKKYDEAGLLSLKNPELINRMNKEELKSLLGYYEGYIREHVILKDLVSIFGR